MTEDDPAFEALLEFLKESRGFDFTGYKRSSLMRRVARRTQALNLEGGWTEYLPTSRYTRTSTRSCSTRS
ncbi:hypothetical protein [Cryptosporangium sp. NPDC051539]|uniref:hypothetical protein n=1 Tax=Cryptosporangium sp. NPDC051539 TaxID=3363962 RepID=UPI00379202DB